MKKILALGIVLIIISFMLASCNDINTVQTSANVSNSTPISELSETVSSESEKNNDLMLVPVNHFENEAYVPVAVNADDITDEECEFLTLSLYDDVISIAREFYGFPQYLHNSAGEQIVGGKDWQGNDITYTEVYYYPNENITSSIVFENDIEMLEDVVDEYFSESLKNSAFSLAFPCPIYYEDGKLYRTTYEPGFGESCCDIAAGRIVSRDNGIVKYAFPIYDVNIVSDTPYTDTWSMGYIDYVYENGKWLINDFRFGTEIYAQYEFPGGQWDVFKMSDYFDITLACEFENILVGLNNGNVTVSFDEKTVITELSGNICEIAGIEKAGGNMFISFNGALGEMETIVISQENGEIVSKFVSNGYCLSETGDWYYTVIDYEERGIDVCDKTGTAIRGVAAIVYENAFELNLPLIPPVDDVAIKEDGTFVITYDISVYLPE